MDNPNHVPLYPNYHLPTFLHHPYIFYLIFDHEYFQFENNFFKSFLTNDILLQIHLMILYISDFVVVKSICKICYSYTVYKSSILQQYQLFCFARLHGCPQQDITEKMVLMD